MDVPGICLSCYTSRLSFALFVKVKTSEDYDYDLDIRDINQKGSCSLLYLIFHHCQGLDQFNEKEHT
jgi:hypothetical protein